jgi:hypothetical protein
MTMKFSHPTPLSHRFGQPTDPFAFAERARSRFGVSAPGLRSWEGVVYFAFALDACSRSIVG